MKYIPVLLFSLFLMACGSDINSGSQGVGQQCFFPSDCMAGLSCYNRVCAPIGGAGPIQPDAGPDAKNDTTPLPDVTPLPDMVACRTGDRRCISETEVEECVRGNWEPNQFCSDGSVCVSGNCLFDTPPNCNDNDGDGYGDGCDLGPDCDDNNGRVNPRQRENCNTPFDDNCNGDVNENCDMECCPGGCGDQEFCNNSCECVTVDPRICEYQDQPCQNDGSFNNGFLCVALNENAPLRCYGLCDKSIPNPNSSCPEAGSVCSFGDQNQGICLTACDGATGCAAADNGCLKIDTGPKEGICVPMNPNNQIGDRCNPEAFFDCEENAFCIDPQNNGRGRCVESCRPFALDRDGPQSDCSSGHCLAFSATIGTCTQDNGAVEGDSCRPQNTSCGRDAVGCYPNGQGRVECQRVCRLDVGASDCLDEGVCFDLGGNSDIGLCR